VFRSNGVNEFGAGIRRATEGFGAKDDSDYTRLKRSTTGFTAAQFNPRLNPEGYLPFVRFGLNTTGIDTPDFTYDNRIGATAYDWLASIRDNITWTRGRHTFKAGADYNGFNMRNNSFALSLFGAYTFPTLEAFIARNAAQCGYCTPGMLLTAAELLKQSPAPTREEIREHLSGNYCRCTGYHAIVDAVATVAARRNGEVAT
jgi:hypothetical protein